MINHAVSVAEVFGMRIRLQAMNGSGMIIVSRWCADTESYVDQCTCAMAEVGAAIEGLRKQRAKSVGQVSPTQVKKTA